jgi:hypothetical protein
MSLSQNNIYVLFLGLMIPRLMSSCGTRNSDTGNSQSRECLARCKIRMPRHVTRRYFCTLFGRYSSQVRPMAPSEAKHISSENHE